MLHTPGPWIVRDLPTGQRYIGPSDDGGAPSVALVLSRANVSEDRLKADAALIADAPNLLKERDIALAMLADWCVAVDVNGTGWDDWDEHYKDAMYRSGPLREKLDAAIAKARTQML